MRDQRIERVARNESRFRKINETLRDDLGKLRSVPQVVPFVCECGRSECTAVVELTIAEYERVRADSRRFAVSPGHELLDVETVVDRQERYFVIEKLGEGKAIADAYDPRDSDTPG